MVGFVWKKLIAIATIVNLFIFLGLSAAEERRRKKKSRWGGSDNEKTFIPGMPTVLPSTLSADQQEAYLGNYSLSLSNQTFYSHAVIHWLPIQLILYNIGWPRGRYREPRHTFRVHRFQRVIVVCCE